VLEVKHNGYCGDCMSYDIILIHLSNWDIKKQLTRKQTEHEDKIIQLSEIKTTIQKNIVSNPLIGHIKIDANSLV
jgi:hypothetical protein